MSDDKESDKRDHICENYSYRLTDDIEVMRLGNLSLQKNIDNVEK